MGKFSWILVAFIILILFAGYSFFYGQNSFRVRDVKVEIEGPGRVNSGEESIYLIKYINDTQVSLSDLELNFEGKVFKLEDLPANSEGQIEISARILGRPGQSKELKAILHYIPKNFSSAFESQEKFPIKIISSSIIASLEAPERVVSGEVKEYVLSFFSKSNEEFKDLEVTFEFPQNFTLTQGQEKVLVRNLIKDEVKTIKFSGFISGATGEEQEFRAKISDITEASASVIISGSPLSLRQTVNGDVFPGQELEFILDFNNLSATEFNDGKITLDLIGNAFDFSSIKVKDGSFDKFQKKITWTGGGVRELKSLGDGRVSFKIKIKDKLAINSFNDKNFFLKTKGLLETKEGIRASFDRVIKISSRVTFKASAFYNESSVAIENLGPLPPKVGESTNYTVHWQLSNGANDLNGVIVTASLPAHIFWTGQFQISKGSIYYNKDSNQVVWELGNISAHTGSLLPAQEAVFQIQLKPVASQIGSLAPLINASILSGQDSFTGEVLSSRASALNSELVYDPTISYKQGIVVK